MKNYALVDHKIQETSVSLPNPYKVEIENFDNEVDDEIDRLYKAGSFNFEPQQPES